MQQCGCSNYCAVLLAAALSFCSSAWTCALRMLPGLTKFLSMCRYDRSLWHNAVTPVLGPAHTGPTACEVKTEREAPKHVMPRGTLQSLKQRMAIVLDVELCRAS